MKSLLLAAALLPLACTIQPTDVLFPRSPPDAGLPDAGPPDAGPPPSLCPGMDAVLCDGFEGASLSLFPSGTWNQVQIGATVSLDTTHSYRGAHSLHIHTVPTDAGFIAQGELTETTVIPLPDFHVREFVYVPSPAPASGMRLLGVLADSTSFLGPSLGLDRDALTTESYQVAPVRSGTPFPLDRWVCVEFEAQPVADGGMRVWLDGAELGDIAYRGDLSMQGTPNRFSLGMAFFGNAVNLPPYDFWIDEVVLDSKPIGCNR